MYEAITVLVRQLLLSLGTYLWTTGQIDQVQIDPLVGAGMALFSVLWMSWDRFIKPKWFK